MKSENDNFAPLQFLASWQWTRLRYEILKKFGRRCQCCGATPDDGAVMHVDHIKPRSTHPQLSLDPDNLQVLCASCNKGKSNLDETDWRDEPFTDERLPEGADQHLAEMKNERNALGGRLDVAEGVARICPNSRA